MNKPIKYLALLLIIIMPIAAYADGRVRFNYRVSGSDSNPELGAKTVSNYKQADGSDGSPQDKLDSQRFSSFSLHYISDLA
tara:strand:- start:302 stop:544 length:243 start_codon:yes stop_codon:yes gene_type:complete